MNHVLVSVEQSSQTPTEFPFPPRRTYSPFYLDPLGLDVFLHSAWIDHDMLRTGTRVINSQPDYGSSISLHRHRMPFPFRQVSVTEHRPDPVLSNPIRSQLAGLFPRERGELPRVCSLCSVSDFKFADRSKGRGRKQASRVIYDGACQNRGRYVITASFLDNSTTLFFLPCFCTYCIFGYSSLIMEYNLYL